MDRLEILAKAMESLNRITEASAEVLDTLQANSDAVRAIINEVSDSDDYYSDFYLDCEYPDLCEANLPDGGLGFVDSITNISGDNLEELSDKMVEAIRSEKENGMMGIHALQIDIPEGTDYRELTKMVNQKLTGLYTKSIQNKKEDDNDGFDFESCI